MARNCNQHPLPVEEDLPLACYTFGFEYDVVSLGHEETVLDDVPQAKHASSHQVTLRLEAGYEPVDASNEIVEDDVKARTCGIVRIVQFEFVRLVTKLLT